MVNLATIHTILSLSITNQWPIKQLDVKNAFLHNHLQEIVYMHQPPSFQDPSKPNHVCLLQRPLYGLKKAPRAWFHRFSMFISRLGFVHIRCDSSLFIYRHGSHTACLLLYVDDIVLTGSSTPLLSQTVATLSVEFSLTY